MKPLLSLAAIGGLCALLLAGTHTYTAHDIEANREANAWRVAFELAGSEFPTADLRWDGDRLELPNGVRLRRASANGYAGEIEFLAAFRPGRDGGAALVGVRVTRHRETPGLGDFIDTARSPWIYRFSEMLPEDVDAVTGATITSEAVKRGVSELLQSVAEPMPPGRAGSKASEPGESGSQAKPARQPTSADSPVGSTAKSTVATPTRQNASLPQAEEQP